MTLIEPMPQMKKQDYPADMFEIPRHDARYSIVSSVGEDESPQVVEKAQQIHGVSYVNYDYFDESGKMDDGRLVPDLDGTRSDMSGKVVASYFVAFPAGGVVEHAKATVRLLDIGANGSLEDLPTYKYFADTFDDNTKTGLKSVIDTYGNSSVREVAALGTIESGEHRGSFELMRALVQNSVLKDAAGHPELYLASLTDSSFRPVLGFIHPKSANILSKPVRIFSDDPRSKLIYVTPVLMDLSAVIQNTAQAVESAHTSSEAAKLEANLRFITDGLPEDLVDQYINAYSNKIV